jgi:hypothetical protein
MTFDTRTTEALAVGEHLTSADLPGPRIAAGEAK